MQSIEYTDKDGNVKSVKVRYKDTVQHSLGLRPDDVFDKGILPLPIIFNRTESAHGKEFVRFPEEMNGKGCFGAVLMQALTGAGYSLHWPRAYQELNSNSNFLPVMGSTSSEEKYRHCTCKQSKSSGEAVVKFLHTLKKYFDRAAELRQEGLRDVYAREKFGVNFENDQRAMKEKQSQTEMGEEI